MAKATGHGGRDVPDYSLIIPNFELLHTVNTGVLTPQSGAPNIHRLSGNILALEQFTHGMNTWDTSDSGLNSEPTLNGQYYFRTPYSLRLRSSGVGTPRSIIRNDFWFPFDSIIGLEFAFLKELVDDNFYFYIELYDGTMLHKAEIRMAFGTNTVMLTKANGQYYNIYDYDVGYDLTNVWEIHKIVIDLSTKMYVRYINNDNEYDISAYGLYSEANTTYPKMRVYFDLEPQSTSPDTVYIDNVIITIDEPE